MASAHREKEVELQSMNLKVKDCVSTRNRCSDVYMLYDALESILPPTHTPLKYLGIGLKEALKKYK